MLDILFGRQGSGDRQPLRREPRLHMPSSTPENKPEPEAIQALRNMTPRQMAEWAYEMYMTGNISWTEYRVAIPAELHPDYDRTVGALTGQPAQPDEPRDMIKEWQDKLAFARRYGDSGDLQVRQVERIIALLCGPAPGRVSAA